MSSWISPTATSCVKSNCSHITTAARVFIQAIICQRSQSLSVFMCHLSWFHHSVISSLQTECELFYTDFTAHMNRPILMWTEWGTLFKWFVKVTGQWLASKWDCFHEPHHFTLVIGRGQDINYSFLNNLYEVSNGLGWQHLLPVMLVVLTPSYRTEL